MKKTFALTAVLFVFVPMTIAFAIWMKIPTEKEIRGCIVTTMYKVNLCNLNSSYVPLKRISPYLVKAIVLTEDSRFWDHKGFDWESIKKTYEENQKVGFYKRGGSTITQQLAKNMFLSAEKSLIRKGLEALITVKIEKVLAKKEILERYLNVVEFGQDIYGVKAAAQHYFKKHPADLDVVESAFLAMLLPNPKKYAASYYRKELTPFASKRINQIVRNMYQYNRISDVEFNDALVKLEGFFRPAQIELVDQPLESSDETLTLEQLEESANSEEEL